MKHEVYLLGGNIKNHLWKLLCLVDDHGNLINNNHFKFIDESNDVFYGLWGKQNKNERSIKNGSNSLTIEREIRFDKSLLQWNEPHKNHRWDSEGASHAVMKRWRRMWSRGETSRYKKIKLCGGKLEIRSSWRLVLKIREDGNKIYSYFEF